ncbi:MAG: hypothetical protein SGILL_000364 [Bacillariaceae sp.]
MKAVSLLLLVVLAITSTGSHAFVPNTGSSSSGSTSTSNQKRTSERRPAFSAAPVMDTKEELVPASTPSSMFALPPSAMTAALTAAYEEEEPDVSYGVAMVSCVLSLALGFGIGYGV